MRHVLLLITVVICSTSYAQQHAHLAYDNLYMQRGMELFDEKKYNAAIMQFEEYLKTAPETDNSRSEAQYYLALGKLFADQSDGESAVLNFLQNNPGSHKTHMANMAIGDYYYENKQYGTARRYYESVDELAVPNDLKNQFRYRKGYTQVVSKKYNKAYETLKPLTKSESDYKVLASYYFGYCAYRQGNYTEAYNSFKSIENNGPEDVKFYLAQINYVRGEYAKTLAVLDGYTKKDRELDLLRGKCYYRLDNMSKASEYFGLTNYKPSDLQNLEKYEFGTAYYKTSKYEKAIEYLKPIGFQGDTLSQQAAYNLALAELKLNHKREAFNAFSEAYRAGFDKNVAENALFNQAKVAIELGDNNSNTLLQRFIDNYPKSSNIREAKKLLTKQLLSTDNYKEAVNVLESLGEMDASEKEVYQRVAIARGLELFKSRMWTDAINMFNKSIATRSNKNLTAEATFWKAEAYINNEKYDQAATEYQNFINMPSNNNDLYPLAYYGYAYTQYEQKDYATAAPYYKKFIDNLSKGNYSEKLINDAHLRLGDCYFALGQRQQAITAYAYTTGKKSFDADYALFQSGMLYGLQKQYDQKISVMKRLTSEFPNSQFIPNAYYELGSEYWQKNNLREAEKNFMYLVDDYKGHSLVMQCFNNLANIYEQQGQIDKALDMYTRLFEQYPGTPESRTAAEQVKRIYASQGRPEKFVDWYTARGGSISASEKDSLMYYTAFDFYDQGDCVKAIDGFGKYLNEIPKGGFAIQAHYYKGQCHEKLKQSSQAIEEYKFVADASGSAFQEDAILGLLELYGSNAGCADVLAYLEKIEGITKNRDVRHKAWQGMLRCYDVSGQAGKVREVASRILNELGSPDDLKAEALVKSGKWDYADGKKADAAAKFNEVLIKYNNQYSAEAKYRQAIILYDEGSYVKCQDACYEVLDNFSGYDYWLGKSLNLLGDAYLAAGDAINAKATWESVVDGFDNTEIVGEAREKLAKLKNKQ